MPPGFEFTQRLLTYVGHRATLRRASQSVGRAGMALRTTSVLTRNSRAGTVSNRIRSAAAASSLLYEDLGMLKTSTVGERIMRIITEPSTH